MLSLLLLGASHLSAPPELTVRTAAGAVRGRMYEGCRVWRGVPFGAPPTGERRWRAPTAHDGWSGVRAATEPAPQCPQLDIVRGEHLGQEDCLYLSVYAPPQCTPARPCPTLFWIYGGAWTLGSNGEFGLYTGEHLAVSHDVVIVAANYRLDVLGWLALDELADESGAYANYGLRDQRLALRWTRDNVKVSLSLSLSVSLSLSLSLFPLTVCVCEGVRRRPGAVDDLRRERGRFLRLPAPHLTRLERPLLPRDHGVRRVQRPVADTRRSRREALRG